MYRMHRWFRVRSGKGSDARAYVAELAEYLERQYSQGCTGFLEVFGPGHLSCHLMMDFADLVAFEAFWMQLGPDGEFRAIQQKEYEIAIEGTFNQSLLHAV